MKKLIVGLGNPGEQYYNTRHNIGYLVLDALADLLDASFSRDDKIDAQIAETNIDGQKVILLKPETFMNISGEAVKKTIAKFNIKDAAHVWVAYDDAMLPFGTLRVRLEGSSGGHNGIKSLIKLLRQDDFVRFRVGIGEPPEPMPLQDWVLSKFSKDEKNKLPKISKRVAEKLQTALSSDLTNVTENLSK